MGIVIQKSINTTIINYIGVIIGAISVLFIQTEFLSEGEIGEVRLLLDKALLFLPIMLVGMESVASRFYFHFDKSKEGQNSFFSLLFTIPFLFSCLAFVIVFSFREALNIANLNLIAIIAFTYIYIYIIEAFLNTKAKILFPSLLRNVIFRLTYIGLLFLYYFNFIAFSDVLFYFTLLHVFHLLFLFFYFKLNIVFPFSYDFSFWKHPMFKEIMIFCLFLLIGSGSSALVSKLDTIMIESITNNQGFVGIYTIAFSISAFIELPKRPIVQIAAPILAKDLANNEFEKVAILYKKSALNLLIIASLLFSLIWINIDFIFKLIPNGEIYSTGKYVVFFLGLSKVFDLGLGINAEIIHNSKYYKWNLVLMPFLTVITILFNFHFISYYGNATGAAIATLIALVLFNLLRTVLVKWKLGLLPFSKEYFFAIPFVFIPFIIDYFFFSEIENIWVKMFLDSSLVFLFFCLPIYLLKISPDINSIINKTLSKIKL